MGEIADSMLGGDACEMCGEWLNCAINDMRDPCSDNGTPMYCSEVCAKDRGADLAQVCPH